MKKRKGAPARKKIESEMERSRLFLDSIVENIPNMIFVKDAKELRFVLFNKAGENLLGFKREDMLGKNDFDFFPKSEADFFTAKDREVLKNGTLFDIPEEPIHTKNKGTRILHTKKIPVWDDKGQPLYLLGISEDITESKQAERNLKLYADVVNNIQIAFLVWRLEKGGDPRSFRLIAANPGSRQIAGFDMNTVVGKTIEHVFPELLITDVPANFMRVIETGQKVEIDEIRFGGGSQPESEWSLKVFPLPDKCVGVAYENITERKRIEREVLQLIGREQRRIGQDLHDGLGQDLTALSFMSKTLEKRLEDQDPEALAQVREMSKLVNQSINRTKNLARGLHPVELESNGLESALEELAKSVQDVYKTNCLFKPNGAVSIQNFDKANHLYRLAQEAVFNAVKHASAQAIEIRLASTDGKVTLTIEDNGTGIATENIRNSQGMGFHIMNYRARMIGGVLKVESKKEGGTRVECSASLS